MENQQAEQAPARTLNNFITVVDLDGCISDDRWRRKLLPTAAGGSYDAYHAECDQDPLLGIGAATLREHINDGDFIIFATGRPISVAEKTAKWIARHFGIKAFQDFTLVMRNDTDFRPAVELKNEFVTFIARHCLETKKTVRMAYDDRPDVVEMYTKSGLAAMVMDADGIRAWDAAAIAEDLVQIDRIIAQDRERAQLDKAMDTAAERGTTRLDYRDVSTLLRDMADGFEAKNAVYGNSGIKAGAVLSALFPDGLELRTYEDFRKFIHLERVIVKLVRFVNSGMTHKDSIYDASVYAAMVHSEVK